MITKNPWLGLASYEEPKGDNNDFIFCGRDEETLDMVRLIENNLFVTLYGSSGIGKTSLLKAGVIPILRKKDYYPLYVRLSQENKELSYAEIIINKLRNSDLREECGAEIDCNEGNDRLYLWKYFATTRFYNTDGREVYPVIIFDQFEEVFRNSDINKAEVLLKQIYLLMNDEIDMPDIHGYCNDTNYRFVASIREDFLFVLEDSIDEYSLDLYKNNRYRLRAMKPEQAKQVVLIPGKYCVDETQKEAIAEKIIALSRRTQSNDIDTLLISLVCSGTYDKKTKEKISLADLSIWNNNPMGVYYNDAVKSLSIEQQRYVQNRFIRDDGSRRSVDVEDAKQNLGDEAYQQLTKGTNRLFAIGDKGKVELLHDQLGLSVFEARKAFEEKDKKWKLRKKRLVFLSVVFLLLVLCILFIQYRDIKKANWKSKENIARYIAEKAQSLVDECDTYKAQRLLLEVLPNDLDNRPYTSEAERALRYSILHQNVFKITGHDGYVKKAVFSPNDSLIVSVSADNTVRIWNVENGLCIKTLIGHTKEVNSVAYNSDGSRIVSASYDGTIRIWDANNGKCLDTLIGHTATVNSVAYNSDGSRIVSASYDKTIRIWDANNGKCLDTLIGHTASVNSVAYNCDGSRIASASNDKTIRIWNANTGECIDTLTEHYDMVYAVSFNDDGKIIASASKDTNVKLWDVNTGRCIKTYNKRSGQVGGSISFDHGGNRLVETHYPSSDIIVWSINDNTNQTIPTEKHVGCVSFNNDGSRFASASYRNNTISIWDMKLNRVATLIGHTDSIVSIRYSPDGERIVSASWDKTIRIWDANNGKCLDTLVEHTAKVNSADYNCDGSRIVSASDDRTIRIWDANNGKCLQVYAKDYNAGINNVSYCPPYCNYIISSSDDKVILYDTHGFRNYQLNNKGNTRIASVFCTSDGRSIIVLFNSGAGLNSVMKKFDIKTYQGELESIDNIKDYYACLSSNGRYILSIERNKIFIRDASTMELIHVFECGYGSQALCVTYSLENNCILSGHVDGIRIWDFPPLQDLIDQTRERFKDRPLTPEERRMYYLE